ncbi:MAG TPA: hypothetical protein VGO40_03680 [Longimicrobium sp.]|jgi:hypothetical protein|nr:hypothetical protein [Longimicrobium sp.]
MQGSIVHPELFIPLRAVDPMSFLKRIAALATHAVNQAESLVHKAEVKPHAAPDVLPPALIAELNKQAASVTAHLVTPPQRMGLASAAKADLAPAAAADALAVQPAAPQRSVALSSDGDRVVQWHFPKLDGSLPVWVDRAGKDGRTFVVAHFPDLGGAAVDAVREIEQLRHKPAIKRLDRESLHPDRQQAPTPTTAAEVAELAHVYADERGVAPIPAGAPRPAPDPRDLRPVYGIAFSPLLLWGDLLGRLQRHYGGGVFGFDHETLSVGPLENAKVLIPLLPANTPIDILCHSRGGLVTRALLQHPDCQKLLRDANVQIRSVIFMGAANQGSQLAEPDHLADMIAMFTGLSGLLGGADGKTPLFELLLAAVRVLVTPAADLPGVSALRRDSSLIGELSRAGAPLCDRYAFVQANFGNSGDARLRLLEPIAKRGFRSALNDLVVPFDGMMGMGGAPPQAIRNVLTLDHEVTPQGSVYHLNYLDSPRVREHITDFLGVP